MMGHECKKCCGIMKIVFGGLLLLNAFIWPLWMGIDGWIKWIAVLFVFFGFLKLVVPKDACKECGKASK